VLHDNPRLDVREVAVPRQPHVVLLDSRLQTPTDARLFQTSRSCFVGTRVENSPKLSVLKDKGVAVWPLPAAANGHGVCLTALMAHLQQLQVNELHVEAGSVLNGALLEGGWIDEWLVYLAPKLMGPGRGIAQWGPLSAMAQAHELTWTDIQRLGVDIRLMARPTTQADFWIHNTRNKKS
jgi:diaminohydroxyphosphoribosylaminopyrimidine deaminase/5-amino-6-(5-phosphoribosylamino)uracil reductase